MADAALAVSVTLVISLVVAVDRSEISPVEGIVCAAAFGALLLLRRRFPVLVLITTIIGIFGYYAAGFPPIGMVLPAVGALYSAAEMRRTLWAIGCATVLIAVASFYRMDGTEPTAALNGYSFVTELALAAAAIALGVVVRMVREARERSARIAELTAAEQTHAAQARRQAERMQIARDLHDTIGHTLSVASLHAGVAAEADDLPATRAALAEVRAATSDALRELRRTVKVLRADHLPEAAPVLGLGSVDPLLAAVRAAGIRVDVDLTAVTLPAGVDAAAYRIVQESLTNVLRHADASCVAVSARLVDRRLELRVADDGAAADGEGRDGAATDGAATDGALTDGAGIRGMRERAELLGGTLSTVRSASGFVVDAILPLDAPELDEPRGSALPTREEPS